MSCFRSHLILVAQATHYKVSIQIVNDSCRHCYDYNVTILLFYCGSFYLKFPFLFLLAVPAPSVDHGCSIAFNSTSLKYSFLYSWTINNNDCSIVNNILIFRLRFTSLENKVSNGFYRDALLLQTDFVEPVNYVL